MSDLPFHHDDEPPPTLAGAVGRRCRHDWVTCGPDYRPDSFYGNPLDFGRDRCRFCLRFKDPVRARRGRTSREYGNRAELKVARTYGGTKIGQAGGPVDVRGAEWHTQVKTHRRRPPQEWRDAFAKMAASTDRLPRLLVRFVFPGGPEDYVIVPGKAWLDWHGKDE
jgi:hypothetical protein